MNDLKEIGGFIVSADPFVQHDNSLSGNGTVNSPLGVVPGYNETVLWEGTLPCTANAKTAQMSESITSFNEVKVYGLNHNNYPWFSQLWVNSANLYGAGVQQWWNIPKELDVSRWHISGNVIESMSGVWFNFNNSSTNTANNTVTKVIGVNRKA